jgi:geranylgeranyl diphosphate synthase type I
MAQERLARRELGPAVARIGARVVEAIDGLRGAARSAEWAQALAATRLLAEAPQHHLRSQLVLIGDLAGGGRGEGEAVEELAVGLELLHLFMLVHDDVIDEAGMRRGRPPVHVALLGAAPSLGRNDARNLAIVVGNLLHVLGMEHVVRADRAGAATRVVLDACRRTGVGQFEDVVGWKGVGQGMELDTHRLRALMEDKSAHQAFAAPLVAGLLRVNPDADARAARAWGLRMGVALQALDDLADLVGNPAETGKDSFRDLIEGWLSLAVLVLHERATHPDEREFLSSVIGANVVTPPERRTLQRMIEAHGVVEACRAFVRDEIAAARAIADEAAFVPVARDALAAIERGLAEAVAALA